MSAVPVTRPRSSSRSRTKVRTRSRHALSQSQTQVTSRVTTFLIIAGITFLVSSLSGQVMVEKARKEGFLAMSRAMDARKNEANLRHRLDSLTSLTSVTEWAKTHNFLAPDEAAADKAAAKGKHGVPAVAADAPPAAAVDAPDLNRSPDPVAASKLPAHPKRSHRAKRSKAVLDTALAENNNGVNGDAQQD